jgi:hypothetical protein
MATLKVKIQEDIVLDNQDYSSKRTLEISSIDEIYKRIVDLPSNQSTTIVTFGSNIYDQIGNLDTEDSKYIRITNLHSSTAVELAIVGAATLYQVKLKAGHSHILGSADGLMLSEADTSPSFGTMADVNSIICNPGALPIGTTVKLELFIASA